MQLGEERLVGVGRRQDTHRLALGHDAQAGEIRLASAPARPVAVRVETSYVPAADGSEAKAHSEGFVVRRLFLRIPKGDAPPERVPVDKPALRFSLGTGEVIEERAQVVNPKERHYVAVVVPLAAGVEVLNPNLHPGVDPLSIVRAFRDNLRSGRRVSGASTLAMQVARMQRKALKAGSAFLMTLRHGRQGVLAQYLRIVPYGNRAHGIAYAARIYLDKPVEDLSWAEIAFLTAIPQAPAHTNPFLPSGRARAVARGQAILDRLRASGVLSAEEHDLARQQVARLQVPPPGERPREAFHAVLRLEAMLRAEAARGKGPPPIVRTSIDLDVQTAAADAVLRAQRK